MVCLNETGIVGDEVCDGVDDDCDNFVDEGFTYDGIAIGEFCVGEGICGIGLVECASGLNAATCSTNPYGSESQAVEEVCANSLDDDCDGATDESPCQ